VPCDSVGRARSKASLAAATMKRRLRRVARTALRLFRLGGRAAGNTPAFIAPASVRQRCAISLRTDSRNRSNAARTKRCAACQW